MSSSLTLPKVLIYMYKSKEPLTYNKLVTDLCGPKDNNVTFVPAVLKLNKIMNMALRSGAIVRCNHKYSASTEDITDINLNETCAQENSGAENANAQDNNNTPEPNDNIQDNVIALANSN